jgi:hypothetical protein
MGNDLKKGEISNDDAKIAEISNNDAPNEELEQKYRRERDLEILKQKNKETEKMLEESQKQLAELKQKMEKETEEKLKESQTQLSEPQTCTEDQPETDKVNICCPICFEVFSSELMPLDLKVCNHSVCKPCLKTSFEECGKRCSVCVKTIPYDLDQLPNNNKLLISILKQNSEEYEIIIVNLEGNPQKIKVKSNMNIGDLKKSLENKVGIEPKFQYLVFGSKNVQNDKTLSFYGIKKGSKLHLIRKYTGGLI